MARSFNGSNQYITATASAVILSPPFSMACWFRTAVLTQNMALMALNRTANSPHRHTLSAAGELSGDPIAVVSADSSGVSSATSNGGFKANTWHHACGIWYAANSRSAFLDGGNKGTSGATLNPASLSALHIGVRRVETGLDNHFSGNIALAAVWDVALTDSEVAALATGYRPDQIRPQNLVAYLPLEPSIIDLRGNAWANTGTTNSFDHPPLR